jgi:peptide deformylase
MTREVEFFMKTNPKLAMDLAQRLLYTRTHLAHKYSIVTYPSLVLTKQALNVTEFNEELEDLCFNMLYTMYLSSGIGLAAPQIGLSKRIFVMDIHYDKHEPKEENQKEGQFEEVVFENLRPQIFINPVLELGEEIIPFSEGCLSLPGIYEQVDRSRTVKVTYQNTKGKTLQLNAEDLLSICIQHENDHLNGVVLLDRLGPVKKNLLRTKLQKLKQKQRKKD